MPDFIVQTQHLEKDHFKRDALTEVPGGRLVTVRSVLSIVGRPISPFPVVPSEAYPSTEVIVTSSEDEVVTHMTEFCLAVSVASENPIFYDEMALRSLNLMRLLDMGKQLSKLNSQDSGNSSPENPTGMYL